MKTLEELDRLHAAATAGEWVHDDRDMWGCVRAPGILLTVFGAAGDGEQRATCAFIAAAKNAWPEVSARLRAAEAVLRALVACDDAIAAGREPPTSRRDLAAQARATLGERR